MPKNTVPETATELPQLIDALNTHAIDKVELTVEGDAQAVLLSFEDYTKIQEAILNAQSRRHPSPQHRNPKKKGQPLRD